MSSDHSDYGLANYGKIASRNNIERWIVAVEWFETKRR